MSGMGTGVRNIHDLKLFAGDRNQFYLPGCSGQQHSQTDSGDCSRDGQCPVQSCHRGVGERPGEGGGPGVGGLCDQAEQPCSCDILVPGRLQTDQCGADQCH